MQQAKRIQLTASYPSLVLSAHRARAMLTGKPYFFNRQKLRLRVFEDINESIPFDNYIETGTYLGLTTHFLGATARKTGAQVYSSEINEDFHKIAGSIVAGMGNVHLHCGDSVDLLRSLSPTVRDAVNFVYLDAHFGTEYLPLREELDIVRNWPQTVVMIDDFRVPFDEQFNWDKYDGGREISLQYIEISIGSAAIYFPSYQAEEEDVAMPRGYCLISMSERYSKVLDEVPLLRRFR